VKRDDGLEGLVVETLADAELLAEVTEGDLVVWVGAHRNDIETGTRHTAIEARMEWEQPVVRVPCALLFVSNALPPPSYLNTWSY
jgi:hypothetical protein